MTRINIGIKPAKLIDQHLVAEYRELPRVLTLACKSKPNISIPKSFKLGIGHCKFFYSRLEYLHKRYSSLVLEMKTRGFKVNLDIVSSVLNDFHKAPKHLYNDYQPTKADVLIIQARIIASISKIKKKPRYYIKPIPISKAIRLITL